MEREKITSLVRNALDAAEMLAVDAYKKELDVDQIARMSREKLDELLEKEGYSFDQVFEFLRSEFIDDQDDYVDEELYQLLTFMDSLE